MMSESDRYWWPLQTDEERRKHQALRLLMEQAKARYASMSPAEKAAHDQAQRESFARANISTGDPRFD
jgi:ribosomal protein S7